MVRKIIFSVILSLFCMVSFAQEIDNMVDFTSPYVSEFGFLCNTTDTELGQVCSINIECDRNNNVWLNVMVVFAFNVPQLKDTHGNRLDGKYSIEEGKNIFLKLDDDEIFSLKCDYLERVQNGYYTSSNDIYRKYDYHSYFLLDENQVSALLTHKIIKIRAEFNVGIMDLRLKNPESLSNAISKLNDERLNKLKSEKEQEELKDNPLKGF